jgi:hypothetical protein
MSDQAAKRRGEEKDLCQRVERTHGGAAKLTSASHVSPVLLSTAKVLRALKWKLPSGA